jgi:hypothetical protein
MDQADFVLGRFDELEKPFLDDAIRKGVEACEVFVSKGLSFAMNVANAGEKPEKPEKQESKKPEAKAAGVVPAAASKAEANPPPHA